VHEDLEQRLRRALEAPEPPADLSERILARLPATPVTGSGRALRRRPPARRLIPWALAATLLALVLLPLLWHREQERAGLRARAQLIEALRLSSQKLDLAYRTVNRPTFAGGEDDSGA
jgi:hypothetical protein